MHNIRMKPTRTVGWGLRVSVVVVTLLMGHGGFAQQEGKYSSPSSAYGNGTTKQNGAQPAAESMVTLDMQAADVRESLRTVERQTGTRIAIDDRVQGTITMNLQGVPLRDAIAQICAAANLQYRFVDGVYLIEPRPTETAQPSGITSPDIEAMRSSMEQAKAMVRNAEAEAQQQRANVTASEAVFNDMENRLNELKERFNRGEASAKEVRQAERSLAMAKSTLESQKAAVQAAEARVHQSEAILAGARYHLALREAAATRFALPGVGTVSESQLLIPAAPLRQQVSLSMRDATLEDVMNKLSQASGIPITIHEAVPKDFQVVTADLYSVTFAEALHTILQQVGLRAVPTEDRQGILIVPSNKLEIKGSTVPRQFAAAPFNGRSERSPLLYLVADYENGSFNGNGSSNGNKAYCPKCNAALQADWHFCPQCGAKNPLAQANDWKFCPMCGKSVANSSTLRTNSSKPAQTNMRRTSTPLKQRR